MVSFSVVSVEYQLRSGNWEIPETNKQYVLNCKSFWVAQTNLDEISSPLKTPFIHSRYESSLCLAYPTCESLNSRLIYQIHYCGIIVLVFKSPLLALIMAPKFKNSDARNSDMPKKGPNVLLLIEKVKKFSVRKKCMLRLIRSMVITIFRLWNLRKKKSVLVLLLQKLWLRCVKVLREGGKGIKFVAERHKQKTCSDRRQKY